MEAELTDPTEDAVSELLLVKTTTSQQAWAGMQQEWIRNGSGMTT